ncbi:sensor histidine kinase [Enterococcus sp. HY326]|uniref:sensor histidine kinase n=1 Tax=Enterococcus sp. HY326 TaxID=2971265 RepID=UPI00224022C1|nr:HAMP domain-containing sensor histidine kinase [Enterococcus sp. HY326]
MSSLKRWYQKNQNTLQFKLVTRFTAITLSVIFLLGASFLLATGYRLYESTEQETAAIEDALSQVDTQTNDEWRETLRLYIAADDPRYFIRVALSDGNSVYSSDAYSLFSQFGELGQLFFLQDILWEDSTPYYFNQFTVDGTSVAILTDMEDNFEILVTLAQWIFILSGLILIFGIFFILRFSKKISTPLLKMNQEINEIAPEITEQTPLSEPTSPKEVQNLAKSFNHLLTRQQEAMLREQQFITDASHELKTPLAAIRGHVGLIRRRGNEHPEIIPKSLNFIDKESKRMEILTQQLLLLGREKNVNHYTAVDLTDLIEQILEELATEISQDVTFSLAPHVILDGDKQQFYQIFRNLIENAVKYTPANQKIIIHLEPIGPTVQFSVSNTGVTISDSNKKKIFERFYRVDESRSSEIAGSGIGLSIVKQLVELYQGEIAVLDYQDNGVTFQVTLPKI